MKYKTGKEFSITTADKVLRALQLVQLECVEELDRICRKYNIEYALGGGTCLGRYRHGGFIPWDDDIDIDMSAENFDKFIQVAPHEIDNDKFKLVCRETNPLHYRSMSRMEVRNTRLSMPRWDSSEMSVGVFIDIARVVYLPEDDRLRKKVRKKLFFLRATENYFMTNDLSKQLTGFEIIKARLAKRFVPIKRIQNKENAIIKKYCLQPTKWKYADNLTENNFNGYDATGSDTYADVSFEHLCLRDRKDPTPFLKAIFGNNFNEWLPPVKRNTHHMWTAVDLGAYAEKYDLPHNYSDYITFNYNSDKLINMQQVTVNIAKDFDEICKDNNLKYFVVGYDALLLANSLSKSFKYWREPMTIAMPREDYETMLKLDVWQHNPKYFMQSIISECNYYYEHARLRLRYTELRDARLPIDVRASIDNGLYIKIVPMDEAVSEHENKKIDYLSRALFLKWTKNSLDKALKIRKKDKINLIVHFCQSKDKIEKRLKTLMTSGNRYNTEAFRISADNDRFSCNVRKSIFGNGKYHMYNGVALKFPENICCFAKTEYAKKTKGFSDIALNTTGEDDYIKALTTSVIRDYPRCNMSFYDIPDYQLSVLRYDEKKDCMLSNDEIVRMAIDDKKE